MPSLRDLQAHGEIERNGHVWRYRIGGTSVEWVSPPRVLERLVSDLFASTPDDIPMWLHTTAWRLREESWQQRPPRAKTSILSTPSIKSVPNETEIILHNPDEEDLGAPRRRTRTSESSIPSSIAEEDDDDVERNLPSFHSLQVLPSPKPVGAGYFAESFSDDVVTATSTHKTMDPVSSEPKSTVTADAILFSSFFNLRLPSPLRRKWWSPLSSFSPAAQSYAWLSPTSRRNFLWKCIYIVCLLFELWAIPFQLLFWMDGLPPWTHAMDIVFLIVFTVDIFLNLKIGRAREDILHMRLSHFAMPCIRSGLWLDFLATVPYVLCVASSIAVVDVKFIRCISLLRVARLKRMEELSNLMAIFLRVARPCMPLLKLVFVPVFLAHVGAILLASLQHKQWVKGHPDGAYGCYWQSLWLSVLSLTLGSTPPSSREGYQHQILWDLLISVARLVLLVFMLDWSKAYALIKFSTNFKTSNSRDEPSFNELLAYLGRRSVPQSLQIKLLHAFNEAQTVRKDQSRISWLNDQAIDVDLRHDLTCSLWENRIKALGIVVPLVQWRSSFAAELAAHVEEVVLATGVTLFSRGDPMATAYLILKGALAVCEARSSSASLGSPADYTESMWVGEQALVNPDLLHTETLMSRSRTELMGIHVSDFRSLMAQHNLLEKFDHFLQRKLCMGICGRCGVFGDHFSSDCPLVSRRVSGDSDTTPPQPPRFSITSQGQRLFQRKSGKEMAPGDKEELVKLLTLHGLLGMQTHLKRYTVRGINDLHSTAFDEFLQADDTRIPPEDKLKLRKVVERLKRKAVESTTALMRPNSRSNHYIFISHYKIEAGTEATLMRRELEVLLVEAGGHPGNVATSPIFVDSEGLTCLTDLQSIIVSSQNVVILLTPGVLMRPWCLIEIALAYRHEVNLIPVEVQRPNLKFKYPDEAFFKGIRTGTSLPAECLHTLKNEGVLLVELEIALRQLFRLIAVPYSPHKPEAIRDAELQELLKRCTKRSAFTSGDKVMILKEGKMRGKSAIVTDPGWHGLVKVAIEDGDRRGAVKSYKPEDIAAFEHANSFMKLFKPGDHVRVRKQSRTRGKTAVIVDANWNGLVKVTMHEADAKGITKSFEASDLELVQTEHVEL